MSSAAQRRRARRSRQAAEGIWVPVEVEEIPWVTELIAAGLLAADDEEDRRAIGSTLSKFWIW